MRYQTAPHPDNTVHLSRTTLFVKFALSNPVIAFNLILEHLQVFDNMIEASVDGLRYLTSLALDTIAFTLIDQLSGSKDKMSSDGVNEEKWFQNLCTFTGHFFRKHPEVPLNPASLRFVIEFSCFRRLT